MSSYLLHESNNALCALTVAPELRIIIFNPRGKIIQNVKFSLVSQNSGLSSKLDSNHQNESGEYLIFKIEPQKYINQNCTQNNITRVTLENAFFNHSLFSKSKTATRFVTSKQVQEWFQFFDFKSQLVLHAKREKL